MASREELVRAIAPLIRAGVSVGDANELLREMDGAERVLVLLALEHEPRPGDRVRVSGAGREERSMVVLSVAPARAAVAGGRLTQRWAVVGEDVRPSARDDVVIVR
jgi:hypothetical protein